MSLGPEPGEDPSGGDDRPPNGGSVQPTHPGALVLFGALGLLVGWLLRPVSLSAGRLEPQVTWLSIGLVWFIAAIVAGAAYATSRARRDGLRLQPHQAVNRLVVGKACALVGAVLGGGYLGYAISNLGVTSSDIATTRMWHAAIAGVGGLGVMVAALLLEQACRVRRDGD